MLPGWSSMQISQDKEKFFFQMLKYSQQSRQIDSWRSSADIKRYEFAIFEVWGVKLYFCVYRGLHAAVPWRSSF